MYMDILAGGLVLFLTYVYIQNKKDPKKIFGVYSQPGKWYFLKYPAILTLLAVRRLKVYFLDKESIYDVNEIEKLQPLSSHPLAIDAVFFHAVSKEGVYLCAGTERRHQGKINGLLYVLVPGYGLLKSVKLPNTVLDADPDSLMSGKTYAAEGIKFTPVEPMKRWDIAFSGKMRLHDHPEELVNVEIEAKWTSDLDWFIYDMLPIKVVARSIAREPWSKELFQSLKDAHQTHYEQMGYLEGTIKIDDKVIPLKLDAFRDHSFGHKRDWKLMHRYIFQMFYLENQTRITLGVVSQPCTASQLEMGYVVHPNGKLDTVDTLNLLLYQHGESGTPSEELCFTFIAGDHTYEVKVSYDLTVSHFVGNNEEVKMYERFFTCEVNGIKGRGISEWNYNNLSGKFKLD